jgi:hypothetical protein
VGSRAAIDFGADGLIVDWRTSEILRFAQDDGFGWRMTRFGWRMTRFGWRMTRFGRLIGFVALICCFDLLL